MLKRKLGKVLAVAILVMISQCIFYTAYAETEHFEKGDLIFREGFGIFGHTGIYCKWGEEGKP